MEYLKPSIADLVTLLFSSLQNSKGGGNSDSGESCADPPPIFTISQDQNLNFSLSPSLLRLLAKNLQKQNSLLGSMKRKSKQKNIKKDFKLSAIKQQRFFTKICQ